MPDTLDLSKFGTQGGGSDKLDLSRFPGVTPPAPTPAPVTAGPKEPDFLDRLGMAGGLSGLLSTAKDVITGAPGAREGFASGAGEAAQQIAPTAVRMGSGVLGAEGGPIGAAVAGGGETLAQMLEKGTVDPRQLEKARIAVAAGTGAIPFGKITQEGRVATSALRGGALAGGGETAREALAGEHFDPKAVGSATALGAAGAGGASKLATMFGVNPKLGAAQEEGAVAAVPRPRSTSQQESALRRQLNSEGIPARGSVKSEDILPTGAREFDLGPIESPGIGVEQRPSPYPVNPGVQMTGFPAEGNSRVQRVMAKEQAAAAKTAATEAKAQAVAEKQAAKDAADARIEAAITEGGLEPGAPSIGENAAGQKSMRIPYRVPSEDAVPPTSGRGTPTVRDLTPAEYAAANAPENPNYPGGALTVPTDVYPEGPAPGPAPAPTAEAPSPLAKLFKSRAGAAGENYGTAKAAEKAGEIGSADEAYNAFARERAALGQNTAPRSTGPASVTDLGQFKEDKFNTLYQKVWQGTATPAESAEAERLFNELSADQPAMPQRQAATPTPPVEPPPTPPTGGGGAPTPNWVQDQTDLADAASQAPSLRQRLLDLAKGEQGSVPLPDLSSDRAKRLLGAGVGAAVGAPIGSKAYGEEDDYGALKGALAGGLVGYNAGRGMNNLVNYRNSMLLASPSPVSKNVLGDMGGMLGETLKQSLTPGQGGYARDLFKNLPFVNPKAYGRDYLQELLHPEGSTTTSMRDVVGEALDKPMELIYRPFSASNVAVRKAMERAGAPRRVIEEASGISTPETPFFQSWLGMQKHPAARYLFPFQKIASNVAEGARNIPGVSLVAGNPADKWQRTAMGGLQMALGSGSELYDEAQAAEGDPTSNWTKGVRPNLLGPKYIAPFAVGQALTAALGQGPAKALQELVSLVPGARATLPAQFPNETADAYATRVLSGPISQMVPGFLKPDPGSAR
jgi:hypothetical protein